MQIITPANSIVICKKAASARDHKVYYDIEVKGKAYEVYFSATRLKLSGSVEAAICMAALGAMRNGCDLLISDPVSESFIKNQEKLFDIFSKWFPEFYRSSFKCHHTKQIEKQSTGRIGCFFTGGVDSFYTFLKHRSVLTDLIYVHGYDVKLEDREKRRAISAMGQAIEKETGVRFIEIETNAIRLFKDFGKWGLHGHGFGLGTIVRLLDDYLDCIYIPSSFATAELMPWASHPETDVLFADEAIAVVHDGCEATRTDKVRLIASEPLALRHLRVCWEKLEGAYNCGRCEKCLRTMTTLYGLGALPASQTFPSKMSAGSIRGLLLESESAKTFARDNVSFLDELGMHNDPVRDAWEVIATRPAWKSRIMRRWRRFKKQLLRQWLKRVKT
ncbi:hypothetical protein [Halopseudomonas salina]|uniref:Uncharacterized protein n=1 Tax=Halopseudomonas salina TaxID=1323744 RepID=A0ABQ1PPG6_9GAMM|nr:hypothetical protein [Halopseudomonas salina]GGD00812.1 hypothetical protein GCM10007418_20070 [Halopseudomonas salina]